jgi:hypothetical protein
MIWIGLAFGIGFLVGAVAAVVLVGWLFPELWRAPP